MNVTDYALIVSVFISLLQAAVSIDCYVCNSGKDPECGEEIFRGTEFVQKCRVEDSKCMKQTTQTYTRKDGYHTKGTTLVTRFCGSENWEGCTESLGAQTFTTQCACKGNRCNTAAFTTKPATLAALMLAAAVLFIGL